MQENICPFYPSEPFALDRYTMRHPVDGVMKLPTKTTSLLPTLKLEFNMPLFLNFQILTLKN